MGKDFKEAISILLCRNCGRNLKEAIKVDRVVCDCGFKYPILDQKILYANPTSLDLFPEKRMRDKQASNYLSHNKFPTQISSVKRFLSGLPTTLDEGISLDLACGPGPYTKMLSKHSDAVLAVDFSSTSLDIASSSITNASVFFIQADLNDFYVEKESCSILLMADFLQHIDGLEKQENLLKRMFSSLKLGGYFYLSFFNPNLKNIIKGDISGNWAGKDKFSEIRYRRLFPKQVKNMLPSQIRITKEYSMNIVGTFPSLDYILSGIPMSRFIARMYVLIGKKISI